MYFMIFSTENVISGMARINGQSLFEIQCNLMLHMFIHMLTSG